MAEVSSKYATLITPAGYAFSIWGVIYLTLAVFAGFQFFNGKEVRFYKLIWPYFLINVAANSLWLVAFQNEAFAVSVALMAVILLTLVSIFKIFYRLKRMMGTTHRYFFHVPFGLYFGWVCVATIVNIAVALQSYQIAFFTANEGLFAILAIAVATVLALVIVIAQKDFIFSFAVLWGLVAIYFNQIDEAVIGYTSKIASIVLIASMIIRFVMDRAKLARYGRSV